MESAIAGVTTISPAFRLDESTSGGSDDELVFEERGAIGGTDGNQVAANWATNNRGGSSSSSSRSESGGGRIESKHSNGNFFEKKSQGATAESSANDGTAGARAAAEAPGAEWKDKDSKASRLPAGVARGAGEAQVEALDSDGSRARHAAHGTVGSGAEWLGSVEGVVSVAAMNAMDGAGFEDASTLTLEANAWEGDALGGVEREQPWVAEGELDESMELALPGDGEADGEAEGSRMDAADGGGGGLENEEDGARWGAAGSFPGAGIAARVMEVEWEDVARTAVRRAVLLFVIARHFVAFMLTSAAALPGQLRRAWWPDDAPGVAQAGGASGARGSGAPGGGGDGGRADLHGWDLDVRAGVGVGGASGNIASRRRSRGSSRRSRSGRATEGMHVGSQQSHVTSMPSPAVASGSDDERIPVSSEGPARTGTIDRSHSHASAAADSHSLFPLPENRVSVGEPASSSSSSARGNFAASPLSRPEDPASPPSLFPQMAAAAATAAAAEPAREAPSHSGNAVGGGERSGQETLNGSARGRAVGAAAKAAAAAAGRGGAGGGGESEADKVFAAAEAEGKSPQQLFSKEARVGKVVPGGGESSTTAAGEAEDLSKEGGKGPKGMGADDPAGAPADGAAGAAEAAAAAATAAGERRRARGKGRPKRAGAGASAGAGAAGRVEEDDPWDVVKRFWSQPAVVKLRMSITMANLTMGLPTFLAHVRWHMVPLLHDLSLPMLAPILFGSGIVFKSVVNNLGIVLPRLGIAVVLLWVLWGCNCVLQRAITKTAERRLVDRNVKDVLVLAVEITMTAAAVVTVLSSVGIRISALVLPLFIVTALAGKVCIAALACLPAINHTSPPTSCPPSPRLPPFPLLVHCTAFKISGVPSAPPCFTSQDLWHNYFGGFFLFAARPFRAGDTLALHCSLSPSAPTTPSDHVSVGTGWFEGVCESVDLRFTVVRSGTLRLFVPNARFLSHEFVVLDTSPLNKTPFSPPPPSSPTFPSRRSPPPSPPPTPTSHSALLSFAPSFTRRKATPSGDRSRVVTSDAGGAAGTPGAKEVVTHPGAGTGAGAGAGSGAGAGIGAVRNAEEEASRRAGSNGSLPHLHRNLSLGRVSAAGLSQPPHSTLSSSSRAPPSPPSACRPVPSDAPGSSSSSTGVRFHQGAVPGGDWSSGNAGGDGGNSSSSSGGGGDSSVGGNGAVRSKPGGFGESAVGNDGVPPAHMQQQGRTAGRQTAREGNGHAGMGTGGAWGSGRDVMGEAGAGRAGEDEEEELDGVAATLATGASISRVIGRSESRTYGSSSNGNGSGNANGNGNGSRTVKDESESRILGDSDSESESDGEDDSGSDKGCDPWEEDCLASWAALGDFPPGPFSPPKMPPPPPWAQGGRFKLKGM
ncbi:unnamed protein product [Closterium sp. NIES-64]|nr:unnamed protein product [Closterium sp. NIES-64]